MVHVLSCSFGSTQSDPFIVGVVLPMYLCVLGEPTRYQLDHVKNQPRSAKFVSFGDNPLVTIL